MTRRCIVAKTKCRRGACNRPPTRIFLRTSPGILRRWGKPVGAANCHGLLVLPCGRGWPSKPRRSSEEVGALSGGAPVTKACLSKPSCRSPSPPTRKANTEPAPKLQPQQPERSGASAPAMAAHIPSAFPCAFVSPATSGCFTNGLDVRRRERCFEQCTVGFGNTAPVAMAWVPSLPGVCVLSCGERAATADPQPSWPPLRPPTVMAPANVLPKFFHFFVATRQESVCSFRSFQWPVTL